ncbi:MAG: hypothetical protein ACO3JL_12605, partial [Myxococcota bacterium]
VLFNKAATGEEGPEAIEDRLALGRLQMSLGRHAEAETTLRELLHLAAGEERALELLAELYRTIGQAVERASALSQRIALRPTSSSERAQLQAQLAVAWLQVEGRSDEAIAALAAAVDDDAAHPDCRAAAEALLERARSAGAMPVHVPAAYLERALRAQGDVVALPKVVELRLQGEDDPAQRAAAMSEVASLLEHSLAQKDFAFLWAANALRELPGDPVIRAEAERLAQETDNLDTLQELYEELVEVVTDAGARAEILKRIAGYVEQGGGSAVEARERLEAAVAAGADDLVTLRDLVRLTSSGADAAAHIEALQRLASAAAAAQDVSAGVEACAQLADVLENLARHDEAIAAARQLRALVPHDAVAIATLERLLRRQERWTDLIELLGSVDDEGSARAERLVRLLRVQLEQLQDLAGAVDTLEALATAAPQLSTTISLGAQLLQVMASDTSALAVKLRGRVATLLEPSYVAGQNWPHVALILRMRLDATDDVGERRVLWGRLNDLFEKTLHQPEQAFMSVGRALLENPGDDELRDRAERIAAKLHDVETLIGVYEDIIDQDMLPPVLRAGYALRCGELCVSTPEGTPRAAEHFERVLALLGSDVGPSTLHDQALEKLERLYRGLGEPNKLAAVLVRRAEFTPADTTGESARRQMLFEAAKISSHAGAFEAAESALRSLLELVPQDLPALRLLAETYRRLEQWSEFAGALRRELDVLGDTDRTRSLDVRYELGVVLDVHLGLPDEALTQLKAILEIAPDHPQTRRYLEERLSARQTLKIDNAAYLQKSYERTGDWAKAIEALRAQSQEHERRGERAQASAVLLRLGTLQEREMPGQEALAFGTLCEAFRYAPEETAVHTALERVAATNDLLEEVCELYEETAAEIDQRGYAELAAKLREAAARIWASSLGELSRAADLYGVVLKDHPRREESAEPLSDLYGKLGRWDDLEALLRRRLLLLDEPLERAPLLVTLADTLRGPLGRGDEALPLLMEIRRNGIEDPKARRSLIELHDAARDFDELRPLLEEELAKCRATEDRPGLVKARGRLAVLYAE